MALRGCNCCVVRWRANRYSPLQALGFLVGEPVRLLRRSWLRRGPLVVQIGNATFALRQDEAECIDVQTLGQAV